VASTITPDVPSKNAIELREGFRELVRWTVFVFGPESLPPAVSLELLATCAISIGVRSDGTGRWSR
jgi:hypothetical protein